MQDTPKVPSYGWASRSILLLSVLIACAQVGVFCQAPDSVENPGQENGGAAVQENGAAAVQPQNVRLGALWSAPTDETGGTKCGAPTMHSRWQAFWSHFTRKGKIGKKAKHATASKPPKKIAARGKQSRKRAAEKLGGATKFAGGSLRLAPQTKMTVLNGRSLSLEQGELLVATRQPVTVQCGALTMSIAKSTIVFLSVEGFNIKIRNLEEPRLHCVHVTAPGKTFTLSAGEEVAIGTSYNDLYSSMYHDRVTRRRMKNYKLGPTELANTCEFSAVSVIKHSSVLTNLRLSQNKEDKAIFKKVMKMTACLTIATASHGWYLPVYFQPPSQEQTAVAAVGAPHAN